MSNRASPPLKALAEQLLVLEASAVGSVRASNSAAFRVCDKLRGPLSRLMGTLGFRSLLSRARALAGAEVPWLLGLHTRPDGSLEGPAGLEAQLDPSTIAAGETVLVSHLIGLLVTFIGPALTVGLLRDVWPGLEYPNL